MYVLYTCSDFVDPLPHEPSRDDAVILIMALLIPIHFTPAQILVDTIHPVMGLPYVIDTTHGKL